MSKFAVSSVATGCLPYGMEWERAEILPHVSPCFTHAKFAARGVQRGDGRAEHCRSSKEAGPPDTK